MTKSTNSELTQKLDRLLLLIMTRSRGLQAILIWVKHHVVENEPGIAYTDGTGIYYCKGFFDFSPQEQIFVICHEALHIALRHVSRAKAVREKDEANYNHALMNVAQDALINYSLEKYTLNEQAEKPWYRMPSVGVRISGLLTPKVLQERPATSWTVEELYTYLWKKQPKIEITEQNANGTGKATITWPDGSKTEVSIDIRESQAAKGSSQEEEDKWERRLQNAIMGDKPCGILRNMGEEVPGSKTNWRSLLRQLLLTALSFTTKPSYSRPGRRYLAGVYPFYIPGNIRESKLRTIAIVVDTSGSVDDSQILQFIGEILAIHKQTHTDLRLIAADAAVATDHIFTEYEQIGKTQKQLVSQIRGMLKGGGGTDFRPAFELLSKCPPDVVVYLTDLAGTFPTKAPKYPVIWASITNNKAPFGKIVHINK